MSRILLIALFAILVAPCLAEDQLTTSELRRLGVHPERLQPIAFSHDDRTLAAFDRATFEEKKEGVFYRLWLFDIQRDGTFGEARSVPITLKNFQQGEFTPDDSHFVLIGNRGTTFQAVDLKSLEVQDILIPEYGEPGFRADPPVLWTEGGRLYVTGHPYDKNRFVETRTVATLQHKSDAEWEFERSRDIGTLEKDIERLQVACYLTDSSGYFGQKYPEVTLLNFWDGEKVTEFDRAWKFSGFWSNGGRLIYSTRRGEGLDSELMLYDAKKDTKTVLATDPEDYRYLFLSRDGRTAITSQLSETEGRLTPWYAKDSEDWKLKPVVTDASGNPRTVPAGWMRLSSTGSHMAHVGPNGIALFDLR